MAGFEPTNNGVDAPQLSTFSMQSMIKRQPSSNAFPMYPAMALPPLCRSNQARVVNLGRGCQYEGCPATDHVNHDPRAVAQRSNAGSMQRPPTSYPPDIISETFTFPVWRAPLATDDTSTERPASESFKREDIPLHDLHSFPALLPTVDECRNAPTHPETPCRPASQLQSPVHFPETYIAASMPSSDLCSTACSSTYTRQDALFVHLEAICTEAAKTYCLSQCASPFNKPPLRLSSSRRAGNRHPPFHPYDASGRAQPRTLAGCISRISQMLWECATASGDHAKELEAVHRMGNLYEWTERLVRAARAEEVLSGEEVEECVLAARDLTCWLLNERGKREIEKLRREWGP